jgi:hypothetical protein
MGKLYQKTTYERRSLHDWRGRDSGCPVAKTYCFIIWIILEGPTIEATVSYDGTMKGSGSRVEVRHIATFMSSMRYGAFLLEGTGVITAKDASGEMATELGRGVTRFVEGGKKVVGRGLFIFSNTSSKTGNLGFLNNLTGVL